MFDKRYIRFLTIMIAAFCGFATAQAQPPDTLWTRTYGGINADNSKAVQQTADGGFIITGQVGLAGQFTTGDLWLIRTNSAGDTLWTKTYSSPGIDQGNDVQQTTDGGFIVAGYRTTADGLDRDLWLLRTDSQGDTLWSKTYGGSSTDEARSVQQTADGGFVITGTTRSFGAGNTDIWLLRSDANGDTLWTKTFGGPFGDTGGSLELTSDGGIIIAGTYWDPNASPDVWLVKTDAAGDTLWTKTYNGPYSSDSFDQGYRVRRTADGGFIIAGETTGAVGTGNSEMWLLRTDAFGDTLWTAVFGDSSIDRGYDAVETMDGGFLTVGYTLDFATSDINARLVRTDANGDSLWTIILGDSGNDQALALQRTSDNGYIISGFTSSSGAGDNDVWLIRLESENPTGIGDGIPAAPANFQLFQNYPNPFNPVTRIQYSVSSGQFIELKIFDLLGREVKTLVKERKPAGSYSVQWDGHNNAGQAVSSGVYLYRLKAGDRSVQTRKMVLLR